MKDLILKWWNRKWSDWEHYDTLVRESVITENIKRIEEILVSTPTDGLKRYKQCIVYKK